MDKTQTIALFGGSFDPPHIGHENIVKALLDLDYINKVVVMPTFINPFKSNSHAPANLRLHWLKVIFEKFNDVEISDFEVNKKEKTPTIKSVEYLLSKYFKIYLVIGADNLESLHKWHDYDKLMKRVSLIVATRDGINIDDFSYKLKIIDDISSTELRKNIDISKLSQPCADEIFKYYEEALS